MHAAILLFLVPVLAADTAPRPEELIHRAIQVGKAQEAKGWKFTWKEDVSEKETTKTFDVIMLEGSNYRKLILVDGKPLDAKMQKRVDADLEKERAARRARKTFSLHRSVSLGGLETLEELFNNRLAGEELVGDRPAWRIESEPKTDHKPTDKDEEQAMSARRTTWIDKEEGTEVRWKSVFVKAANGFQPGTVMEGQQGRVLDDQKGLAWMPASTVFRFDVKFAPMIRAQGETKYRYYDYKRFGSDSRIVE